MKHYSKLLILLFWLALAALSLGAEEMVNTQRQLALGSTLSSKFFDARFLGDGFEIRNKEGGSPVRVYSMPPVYRAAWTSDGRTLATVEHVAGGSDCVCFHFDVDARRWFRMNTVPPRGSYSRYRVAKWNVGESDVALSYEVQTVKNSGISGAMLDLKVDNAAFTTFFKNLIVLGRKEPLAGVFVLSEKESIPRVPASSGAPIKRKGILAIDTDGSGPAHNDPSHQRQTSAMKNGSGQFLPRRDPVPPGFSELDADHDRYAVAPKDLAKVNGGPLEAGKYVEIETRKGKKDRIQLGDFGPLNKNGEVSYAEIEPLGYSIKETAHGPYPQDGNNSDDIPVDVIYYP